MVLKTCVGRRQPGGLPSGRSLALRPHLATGLPWTVVHAERTSLLDERCGRASDGAMRRKYRAG